MKKLLFPIFFLLSVQFLFSQNPLESFDTARCHMATSHKLPINDYPIIYKPKLPNFDLKNTKYRIPYSYWEQQDSTSSIVEMGTFNPNLSLSIPHQGIYFLVIQDVRKYSLLVLEAKATRLDVKGFFDCSIHY